MKQMMVVLARTATVGVLLLKLSAQTMNITRVLAPPVPWIAATNLVVRAVACSGGRAARTATPSGVRVMAHWAARVPASLVIQGDCITIQLVAKDG